MDFFAVLSMIAGLALFLYGMHVMGEGLSKVAGGRLEKILEHFTSNRVKGVLSGAAVTAVIQSSSATTVMVVGFVNSGIMKLSQAVNIIIGANIGTTITSWLLSLSGVSGDSFAVKMMKPENFSAVLAAIGIIMILFVKNEKKRDIGGIFLGFTILMFGMHNMSAAVKPLASVPEFTGILTAFSNPVLGIIIGAVFTAIIQSSSAAVGILQALCLSNAVTCGAALPIIMGQNIGTCVTALLSSIGATKNAKRAAMVHFYFNLIGTVIFVTAFYSINSFMHFKFLSESASVFSVALMHTGFNVVTTAIFLPFGSVLEKLAILTIPDKGEEVLEQDLIDMRFLETPGIAVEQSFNVSKEMFNISFDAMKKSFALLSDYSTEKANEVAELEDKVDHYEDGLGTYLVKLSRKNLSRHDSHTVSIMLYCISDFERISDYAVNIMKAAEEMDSKNISLSDEAKAELNVYTNALMDIAEKTLTVFCTEDRNMAREIEPLEEAIDRLDFQVKVKHIDRLKQGKCTIETGFIFADIMTALERIADHCSNIAACIIEVRDDGYDTHDFLERIRDEEGSKFHKLLDENQKKYSLED